MAETKKINVVPFPQKTEEGFKGHFLNLKLPDLIQMSTQGHMSITLKVTDGGKSGEIFICEGNIIHAVCGKKIGKEAFYKILSWTQGSFRGETYFPPPLQSINLPWEHLLIEAHRKIDESRVNKQEQGQGTKTPSPPDLSGVLSEWVEVHEGIAGIYLFSDKGNLISFSSNEQELPDNISEPFHAIFETSRMLCKQFQMNPCEGVTLNGPEGALAIYPLESSCFIATLFNSDITKKSILLMELKDFYQKIDGIIKASQKTEAENGYR